MRQRSSADRSVQVNGWLGPQKDIMGFARAKPLLKLVTATARRCSLWRLFSVFLDGFTIAVSVADIATDVLVLLEFRELGYQAFFGASAAIFALAQVSYAFLFAATFVDYRRGAAPRIVAFLVVLPLAQLVPLFTWLEALHLPAVSRALRQLRLKPTDSPPDRAGDAGDSLWGFLQAKYQSHAGFLVEAFVEAVPQAVLQTVFVVVARRSTALNTASVGISVFTIASKGYLVSYALDGVTFLFNFLCIVADCLGLFATATLLALGGLPLGPLAFALVALASSGLVLSVLAGHSLLWFTIFDDHLKLRNKKVQQVTGVVSVPFDLYFVRVVAWLLAIVPCIVLFTGARLSLLPVCVLKSIDPDLLRHARFFRYLLRFLHGCGGGEPGLEARLQTANAFLARARLSSGRLARLWEVTPIAERRVAVQRWAAHVGAPPQAPPPPGGGTHSRRYIQDVGNLTSAGEDVALQRALLESLAAGGGKGNSAGSGTLMKARLRRSRAAAWLADRSRGAWREMQARSEVLGVGANGALWRAELCRRPLSCTLRVLAIAALALVAVCAAPLALGHTALVALGVMFPVLHLVPVCAAGGSAGASALPCGLAASYSVALLCVLALAPVVASRHLVWVDLADLRGFPEPFYGGAVVGEIRRRHLRDSMLRRRLGTYVAKHTVSFLERGDM